MRIKIGLNGSNKCPKFEKKFERKRTANFCFCPSHMIHNLGRKTRWKEKCLHVVTRIPLTISGANRDEYPRHILKALKTPLSHYLNNF